MVHDTIYVSRLPSRVRVHVGVSDLSIYCRLQLSGHMSERVRSGTRRSSDHADDTCVEEEDQIAMGVLEGKGRLYSKGIWEIE